MIQESYVTFEEAKAVGKLGFYSEDIISYYIIKNCYDAYDNPTYYKIGDVVYDTYGLSGNEIIGRPTLSLVQKWLREEKRLVLDVLYNPDYDAFEFWIWKNGKRIYEDKCHDDYEAIMTAGIDKCIELLK